MPGDLRVSLRLEAQDLLNPALVESLSKLQILEQATARINGQQAQAASGTHAHAAAQAELAEQAGLAGRALDVAGEHVRGFGQELLAVGGGMLAGLVGVEAVVRTIEKITEAAREAEVANRQLVGRFGAAAGEYREFSEQAAQGTNFTAIQFERASAALQPLLRDYGLTDEQLQGLARTTADLAAANGVDLVQASNDVVSVMRGMTRAGQELGLNLKANVIDSMTGLSDAEKRAVQEGDTLGGAQARLHVIEIEAASAHGQAAEAAGATGDSFARLGKATSDMYETMARTGPVRGLAGALADVASASDKALAAEERLADGYQYGGRAGAQYRAEQAAAQTRTAQAALALSSAQAAGMTSTLPATWQGWSAGVPPLDELRRLEAARKADSDALLASPEHTAILKQEAQRDESDRIFRVVAALDSRTQAQLEAIKTGTDFRDETTRAIEAERAYGTELERSAQKVADLDAQLKGFESNRSQIGGLEKQLEEDRATRLRLGLPELPGETDAIRQLYKAGYSEQLAEGPTALAAALAHLKSGDWDPSRVTADHADVTITNANVVVQNGGGGGGQQSAIGDGGSATRYAGALSTGPAYQSGLGRFGQ